MTDSQLVLFGPSPGPIIATVAPSKTLPENRRQKYEHRAELPLRRKA